MLDWCKWKQGGGGEGSMVHKAERRRRRAAYLVRVELEPHDDGYRLRIKR